VEYFEAERYLLLELNQLDLQSATGRFFEMTGISSSSIRIR
jgi:hypothetical protein